MIERFPSKPYIKDGFPKNITALVNSTAKLECPQIIADLEPFLQWIRTNSSIMDSEDALPTSNVLQVFQRKRKNGEGITQFCTFGSMTFSDFSWCGDCL